MISFFTRFFLYFSSGASSSLVKNNQDICAIVQFLTQSNIALQSTYIKQRYIRGDAPQVCSVCFIDGDTPACMVTCKTPPCSRQYHHSCLYPSLAVVANSSGRAPRDLSHKTFKCFHCSLCMCGESFGHLMIHCSYCGFQKCQKCQGSWIVYYRKLFCLLFVTLMLFLFTDINSPSCNRCNSIIF